MLKTFLACLKYKQQQTRIKLDFRVSKAYQASAEDWPKISGIQSNYKADTDNWYFDSCWQPYFTQETLLLKQFNILYTEICCISDLFSSCLQKETGMICLRGALKGTPLVISTWWAPVIAAMQKLLLFPHSLIQQRYFEVKSKSKLHSYSTHNLKSVFYGGSKKILCQVAN